MAFEPKNITEEVFEDIPHPDVIKVTHQESDESGNLVRVDTINGSSDLLVAPSGSISTTQGDPADSLPISVHTRDVLLSGVQQYFA